MKETLRYSVYEDRVAIPRDFKWKNEKDLTTWDVLQLCNYFGEGIKQVTIQHPNGEIISILDTK